ncbi:MAG: right-handed parallel beta-helix repeat-containing protein [Alphaproteobacteria bacterium]|nr:hypothetical protein [Rhizobiaceae bacterium]MBU3962382.1 right-handed parallel beta-helix repeat-containing protein [Alphaproteobacteria bacterium]MBU4048962.1 right-handed parallel beta-helix repeat-containing protein [Alphaproteobacteria bacterium]MBU4091747.1 right-handed parallel beta-helix repeat-containing protein [Alphaproteobacteria bacterium]MBU4157036.1 right-handed parallel beta-helix repeat-containing protein [Alphaproteobacteria bacterium]
MTFKSASALAQQLSAIMGVAVAFLMLGGTAGAAPTVFWASDPVKPGQTVQLTGIDLDRVEAVEVSRLSDAIGGTGTVDPLPRPAEVLSKTENTLSFVVPSGLEPGVYSATLTSTEAPVVVQLNAPDVYWIQGDRGPAASAGGWLRISGRNIALNELATVRLTASDGREVDIKVEKPDPWSASFLMPADLSPNIYSVRLWNGRGGATAWREAGKIEVETVASTDRPEMELSSRQPDGPDNDDTVRINASLAALGKRGGGALKLKYGNYRLSGSLHIPDGVSLTGESRDLVTLIWKDTETPPQALITGYRDVAVEDLTINAERHRHIIKAGFSIDPSGADGRDISIRRVTIRASSFLRHLEADEPGKRLEAMRQHTKTGVVGLLLAGSNVVVEDCDILTSMRPFVLTRPVGARISGNTFRIGRRGWYGISAPDGVLFENNRIVGADLQASGGGINTFGGPSARNVLVRNNIFETLYGWDRESLTTDGAGGYYRGPITPRSGNMVELRADGLGVSADRNWEGAGLFVLKGRGLGLMARVIRRTGELVELDRDIAALTDATTRVTIVPLQENYLIIGNLFQDVGAAQIFGTGYKHVFAGNRSLRSNGFSAMSLDYRHPQPNFYIQFLGNETTASAFRRTSGISVTGRQFKGNDTLLSVGIVIRENQLHSASTIRIDGRSPVVPSMRNVLVEQNEIERTDIGINVGQGVEELLIRDNTFRDVQVPVKQP